MLLSVTNPKWILVWDCGGDWGRLSQYATCTIVVVVVVVVDHVTLIVDRHDVMITGEHRRVACGQRVGRDG